MNNRPSTIKRFTVYATLACMVLQPAYAAVTDIANVPLSSGSQTPIPNLMFILDDSSSMSRDYLPDYVAKTGLANQTEASAVMPRSDGSQDCTPGDPCYYTGGVNGFNGVAYDPNVNYRAGVKYDGTTWLAAPLSTTALPADAYGALSTGTVNLTNSTVSTDKVWCNQSSGGLCKRNGADNSGNILAAGGLDFDTKSDGTSFTMASGQFPYRSHKSNSSTELFGLPETMPAVVSWVRSATTVTFTTVTPHGLAAGNKVFVKQTGNNNIDGNAWTVNAAGLTALQFQITITTNAGGTAGTAGFYRKHTSATWSRAAGGTLITVTTGAGHGLVTGDLVMIDADNNNQDKLGTAVAVSVTAPTTFTYTGANNGTISGNATWVRTGLYNVLQSSPTANPIVYRITPVEYCSDAALTNCTLATTPGTVPAGFGFPAYLRFCKTLADATATGAVTGSSGSTARCLSKYIETANPPDLPNTYRYARYGLFTRENIVSATTPYGNRATRNDCAAPPNCTYAEEVQNYARWYSYYRTRLTTMKTAGGRALQPFVTNPTASPSQPTKLRVGLITINAQKDGSGTLQSAVQGVRYLKIADFVGGAAGTQSDNWYTKLYQVGKAASPRVDIINVVGATPLREALSRAGWIFAGKMGSGLTGGLTQANDDPVQMSCQRNFSLLTTDGYWNGAGGQKLDGSAMDNRDNVDPKALAPYTDPVVSHETGTWDGNLLPATTAGTNPGGAGTLADVALYYYENDLRGGTAPNTGPATNGAGVNVATNNVPTKPGNKNFVTHQHMVTFSVGMVDGLMRYQSDYETSLTGDFANIRNKANGQCLWTSGTCAWPSPVQDQAPALDDLWHAAVNGRGTYYSGRDAASLASSLEGALSALNLQIAAAAASSTSSPNITQTDRQIFSTTYETDTWGGRIIAQNIDPITGNVDPTIIWQADTQLLTKVAAGADARTIKTFNPAAADKLKNFAWVSLNPTEQAYFSNKCSSNPANMTQCPTLTGGPTQANVNSGANLVGYLRGWTGLELNADFSVGSFRDRKFIEPGGAVTQTILGDTINAKPAYVRAPLVEYGDTGYAAFKSANAARAPRLYVGANDGYMHSFDGNTGSESWAYLPRFLMPGLWVLADAGYNSRHTYFADGSPETADVYDTATSAWKTILVAGVNSGGRGYYALDITNPTTPKGLWEFCSDSTSCGVSSANLGLTYGNPVIGKRSSDGKWVVVVTSGFNNVTPGDGKGYFYVLDAITGALLDTVSTNVGDTLTPSGLTKIAGFFDNAVTDATLRYVYGGDQLGNVWRLDFGPPMAPVTPPALPPAPPPATVGHIATLKDASGKAQPITTKPTLTTIGINKVLYIGTGRYMGTKDLSDPATLTPADTITAWQQSLYAFKDKGTDYGNNLRTGATLVTQTLTALSPTTRTVTTNAVDWNAKDGWVLDFNPGNASPGERVNIDPELVLGTLIVTTNVPVAATGGASCSVGGDSWQYQFDFRTGSFLSTANGNVAGTRTGSVVTVGVAVIQLPSGAIKTIITGADTSKTTGNVNIGAGSGSVRRFSYRER